MAKLYFIHLRRPKSKTDERDDPHYFEGTFGTENCHQKSILSDKSMDLRLHNGDRFAFIQGGTDGPRSKSSNAKIAFITPPLTINKKGNESEFNSVHWNMNGQILPLKYNHQFPLLEKPNLKGFTDNEKVLLKQINPNIFKAKRTTKAGKISSCLRTLCAGVELDQNGQHTIIQDYETYVRQKQSVLGTKIFAVTHKDTFEPSYKESQKQSKKTRTTCSKNKCN